MYRRIIASSGFLALALAVCGCASPCGTGFYAGFNRPPVLNMPVVAGPQVVSYGSQGLATTPIVGSHALAAQAGEMQQVDALAMPMTSRAITSKAMPSSCTMDEICRRIAALQEAISNIAASKRMPGGED